METRPEEQEHIDDNRNSETEHEGEESESIDHYHRSVREKRGMSVDDEYELDDLPFQNVPYYFPAINTDTAEVEDTAPEHFQYSQQHDLGTESKKAYVYMGDKPGLERPHSMETQPSEQEDYHMKHMEIEQHEALQSMGHDHYGSGDNDRRFHDMRASRETSHENTDERDGHQTGAAYINNNDDYEGNGNPDGSNHYIIRNRRGEDGDSESDNGSHLVTRYHTHKEPEYEQNGIPDRLTAIERGESSVMSPGELVNSGGGNEDRKHSEDNDNGRVRAFRGNLEETKAPAWNIDDGDNEYSEDNKDAEDDEDDEYSKDDEDDEYNKDAEDDEDNKDAEDDVDRDVYKEVAEDDEYNKDTEDDDDDVYKEVAEDDKYNKDTEDDEDDVYKEVAEDDEDNGDVEDNEDKEEVGEDEDEYEFKNSGGNFEETEASGWDENDEDSENREDHEDVEGDKDGEDEFQDEISDWDENEEDNEDYKGKEDNESIDDYGDNGDDKNADKEAERDVSGSDFKITEASAYRDDLEEHGAAEWKKGDKGDDPSVSKNKNYELADDVVHARQASQYGYKYSKGVGGSHITEDYKQ